MDLKVPTKKVLSDDCAVNIGRRVQGGQIVNPGEPHYIHKGEWVEVIQLGSIAQYMSLSGLLQSGSGTISPEELAQIETSFTLLVKQLSKRVIEWNWTDLTGDPLPQPYKNEEVLKSLTEDELLWLLVAISGETKGERKNASAPSAEKS